MVSCEYDNSGIYEPKVNENITPPDIQTINLNLDEDTLFLYGSKQVNFNFKSNDIQKIVAVCFYIDNVLAGTVNSSNGYFELDYHGLIEGIHKLSIVLYTKTGTGSIADKLDAEYFALSSKDWIIKVEKEPNYPHAIQTSNNDGFLRLSWTKCNSVDFKEYQIKKYSTNSIYAKTINNEVIDSSYIGEYEYYTVNVVTKAGNVRYWARGEINEELRTEVQNLETNQIIIKWNKNKYYNAFKSYELYQNSNGSNVLVKNTDEINDTTYTINDAYFGDNISLSLKYIPRIVKSNNNIYTIETNATIGFPILTNNNSINGFKVIGKTEFIYLNEGKLLKYSVPNKRIVDQCTISNYISSIDISPSNNIISAKVVWETTLINSQNFTYDTIQDLQYLTGYCNLSTIPISDVKTGIINLNYSNERIGFYVYDFKSKTIKAKYKITEYGIGKGLKISQNGDFIYLQTNDSLKFVQLKDSSFISIFGEKHTKSEPNYLEFDTQDPNRLVYSKGSVLYIKRCIDFSTISEFSLSGERLLNVDFYNNEFLTFIQGHLYIRNFLDGSVLHDIPINFEITSYSNMCYLINHSIILPDKQIMYFAN